jgi:transcriptional regulator with XRE-family HTH domain
MKFSDAYRIIYKSRGYTQQALADTLGIRQSSVSSFLKMGNPSADAMIRYLAPLGYDVALVPVGTRLPDGSMTLSPSDGE